MVRSAPSPAENKASFLRELSEGCVVKKESGLGSMTRFAEVMISHVLLPLRFLLLFLLPGLFLMLLLLLLLVAAYLYLSPRIVFFSVDILINPPTLQCLNSSLVKIILPYSHAILCNVIFTKIMGHCSLVIFHYQVS